jgi:hypothetical protein
VEAQDLKEKQQTDGPSHEALILSEWTTIKELEKMLKSLELTVKEKTSVANVLAFHINTLNKLLAQRGETEQFDEQNLGDYLRDVEPRIARHFRRDFRAWKRTLSFKGR